MSGEARQRFFEASAGERTVPGIWHENYWFRRHEVVYEWLLRTQLCGAADNPPVVLDAGCGEGFGAARLAEQGVRALALDLDVWTAAHLASAYPDLPALRANLVALPLATASVDLLVSLQTIEHLWDQAGFVAECQRVLRSGGRLVLSTPNRLTFPAGNVFHHRELDADELAELLSPFDDVMVTGVHHAGSLAAWEAEHGSIVDAQIAGEPSTWPPALAAAVRDITIADFEVRAASQDCQDLVATAVAR